MRSSSSTREKASASEAKDGASPRDAETRKGNARGNNAESLMPSLELERQEVLVPDRTVPVGRLHELSREARVPYDFLMGAFEIFVDLAVPVTNGRSLAAKGGPPRSGDVGGGGRAGGTRTFDPLTEGELTAEGFAKVLCMMANVDETKNLPSGLLSTSFYSADTDATNNLDFVEFAQWYARHGFSESVLLTAEQKRIRQVARKHGLPIVEVEEYKKAFDRFDEDGSGEIEYEEFVDLLNNLINIPKHLELPASRVRQFWTETVSDKVGAVRFEDFLLFYTRYFANASNPRESKSSPLEEFYHAIRPVPVPRAW